jgi:hypothetical protein
MGVQHEGGCGMTAIAHHATLIAAGGLGPSGIDTFDVNDLANYTSTGDQSGTWVMSGGQLSINPPQGGQSTLTRNGLSAADSWAEVDIVQANDAGVVLNWQSISKYLVVTIDDASSNSGNANKLRLLSRNSTFTSLGTADISFVRGTQHTVRIQRSGTTVNVSFDGTVVLTASDTQNNAAGTRGMRANGNGTNIQSIWNEFRWSIP